jgi:tetratricopeptide (TPR) repeat protein
MEALECSRVKLRRKKSRGIIEKILDTELGRGLELQVHRLRLPSDPALRALMERGAAAQARGDSRAAAALARGMAAGAGRPLRGRMVWPDGGEARRGRAGGPGVLRRGGLPAWRLTGYWWLGQFLRGAGLAERAALFLEQAIRKGPRALDAHLDLARCLKALGHREEAALRLERARPGP